MTTVGTSESVEVGSSEVPAIQIDNATEASQPEKHRADPWRKVLGGLLLAAFLFQAYYVREMLAALVIFTGIFAIGAIVAGVIYLIGRAGESTVAMAEPVARRGVAFAEELRQKAFRRPHSAPAP